MKKILLIIFLLIYNCFSLLSQETIRIMAYNLLYFGSYTSFCTSANNNYATKAAHLHTIVDYIKPDIIAVTELSPNQNSYFAGYILGNSLNINGIKHYRTAPLSNESDSNIVNGLFYDNTKFDLFSNNVIETSVRDINIYTLKYKLYSEPVYISVIIAHLKAGSSSSDEQSRAENIDLVMSFLANFSLSQNYLFVGDLNLYSFEEPAYQKLVNPINPELKFFDPIDQEGNWHDNPIFAHVHTQSTRNDNSNSCFASGGLDDRFDFILANEAVMNGTNNIKYKNESYITFGQDGLRLNSSLISPTNTSLPANVISALYNMSDHLPVYADFYFGDINNIYDYTSFDDKLINVQNPVYEDITIEFPIDYNGDITIIIYEISGKIIYEQVYKSASLINISANYIDPGTYILTIKSNTFFNSFKIIKMPF